jgi:hypothetical protein
VYDVAAGGARLVSENRGIGGFEDLSRDKKHALLNRLVNRGNNNLYLVEVATGKETLLTPHEGPGNFSGEFAPDGRSVYLETDAGRDRTAFARMELAPAGAPQGHDSFRAPGRGDLGFVLTMPARRPRFSGTSPARATSSCWT